MEVEDSEDLFLVDLVAKGAAPIHAGITKTGTVFLRGDIHPLGSATALLKAAHEHIPYVAVNAVNVIFPADWLRAECAHDIDRLRIISNMEQMVRRARL